MSALFHKHRRVALGASGGRRTMHLLATLGLLLGLPLGLAGCATTHKADTSHDWPMVPSTRAANPPPSPKASVAEAPVSAPARAERERVSEPVAADTTALAQLPNLFDRIRLGYQLPDVADPSIDHLVRWYANKPDFLDRTFERGERYLYYIVRELEARHMPLELAFLPVIESSYNPYAYSRARAAGMWQFIPPTAKRYDVRVNWWQDGRRDVVESTRAALDYLQELHTMFDGDWLLAIAAYNCGEQAVLRSMERSRARNRPTDFWHLDLPKETKGYVPSLLAMSRIVANPERYGLEFTPIANKPYFAQVDIGSAIDLRLAAALLQMNEDELHGLNPAFNRWATDPEGPFTLLVPHDRAFEFARQVSSLSLDERIPLERSRLAPGETLEQVAKSRDLPLATLRQLNGMNETLKPGDEILLPASRIAPLKAGLIIEGETAFAGTRRTHRKSYVVHRGDTLASIARKNHVPTQQLADMNGLSAHSKLKPGKKISVETIETPSVAKATPAATAAVPAAASVAAKTTETTKTKASEQKLASTRATRSPSRMQSAAERTVSYVVRSGDTLYAISKKFAVSIEKLKTMNKLNQTDLRPGQTLRLQIAKERDYGG